jgi:glutathione S-transferase
MAAKYKLTYFDLRGRAEVSRLLFAASGTEYEDIRFERSKWPELKPNTPFGQVPMLEVDGVQLCQSKSIARFLAVRFGLAGKNDIETAKCDMILECIEDVLKQTVVYFFEKDQAKQVELKEKFVKEDLPNFIAMFEKLLAQNNGGNFFVGDSMTVADIGFLDLCSWITTTGVTVPLEKAPKLKALHDKVEAHPKIAAWIKNRPVTQL